MTGFHLDEYAGLPVTHKASFRAYMRERFVSKTPQPMKAFNEVNGEAADPEAECARLKALVRAAPIDLACIGFGENGHIAFNDPPADFDTNEAYRLVGTVSWRSTRSAACSRWARAGSRTSQPCPRTPTR